MTAESGNVCIVSGCPGSGKTTVASRLAAEASRGVHLRGDVFLESIVDLIPPHLPESRDQNISAMRATLSAAREYARGGYSVFLDSVIGPWFMDIMREFLLESNIDVHYVVLRADLDETLSRSRARTQDVDDQTVRKMHGAFADLGTFERHVVETTGLGIEDTLQHVRRALADESSLLFLAD